jgi:hypothetical protein
MAVNYFLALRYSRPAQVTPKIGQVIKLDGLPVSSGKRQKLLLAVQVGCPFCEQSMGFYRELVGHSELATSDIIFVLPSSSAEASDYLAQHHITNENILRADLRKLSVGGTPTLILLDAQNRVSQYWVGKLRESQEEEVRRAIGM